MASLPHMFSDDKQEYLVGKTIITLITFEKFFPILCSLMNYKKTFIGKKMITLIAFKILLTTVISLINYKITFIGKAFTTITFKRHLNNVGSLLSKKTLFWAKY